MKNSIWKVLAIAFVALIFFYSNSLAETLIMQKSPSIQKELARSQYQNYQQGQENQDEDIFEDIYEYKEKSTKRAFLYSLLLPGAGEYYANSKVKSAVFLGLEVAFWIGYFNYHSKAGDKEDEYKGYADQYWSEDDYLAWLSEYCHGATSDRDTCFLDPSDTLGSFWTHHLPDNKNQEYYEMIGKYDQFNAGWTDAGDMDEFSLLRESYMDMRYDANKLFDKAKYAVMASLANHLLSAFDAAWTAKRHNQKADRFAEVNFKIRMINKEDELVPKAFVTFKF